MDQEQRPTRLLPRYPVYVPSKGRAQYGQTMQFLQRDGVPYWLVVEPQEEAAYRAAFPAATLLVLDRNNGGLIYARNWIKAHATASGAERHWQLDDNMRGVERRWHGKRIPCRAGLALRITEDFVDRYENVGLAGLAYSMFAPPGEPIPPFWLNVHVYSCTLVLNRLPYAWRARYNDDTDLCLQVLANGWCTVLMNCFLVQKIRTMLVSGGNTTDLYQGDGRLRMARSLERQWPGVVETKRRFQRPQHVVHQQWRAFDTPLRLKPGVVVPTAPDEYGMVLTAVREPKSAALQQFIHDKTRQERG
jgi:hypothetical protein